MFRFLFNCEHYAVEIWWRLRRRTKSLPRPPLILIVLVRAGKEHCWVSTTQNVDTSVHCEGERRYRILLSSREFFGGKARSLQMYSYISNVFAKEDKESSLSFYFFFHCRAAVRFWLGRTSWTVVWEFEFRQREIR